MNELRKEKLAADIEALQENETYVQAVLTAGSIENIVPGAGRLRHRVHRR